MAGLRETLTDYLGTGHDASGDYSLALSTPRGGPRLSQLYGYNVPNYEQYAPADAAPAPPSVGAPPAYPPPPEIVPQPRRASFPPPAAAAAAVGTLPTEQCAAPSPVMAPSGSGRPVYADTVRHAPKARGRGQGRMRQKAEPSAQPQYPSLQRAPTWGRGLGSPRSPVYAPPPGPPPPAAAVEQLGVAQPGPAGDAAMAAAVQQQEDMHHHHHRHHRHVYHDQVVQQQQQIQPQVVQAPSAPPPVSAPPIIVDIGLYGPKEITQRRERAQQPIQHKPFFTIAATIVEVVLFVYELIATSKYSKITFGSNPWQWGGVEVGTLIDIGGKYAPYIITRGEWWRFFTPIFLHVSIIHILLNMCMQVKIGIGLERSYGSLRIAILYVVCGLSGNLLSCIFLYTQIQAGASGALFGYMGLLLVDLIQNWKIVMNPVRNLIILVISVVISLGFGLLPGVDNFAHIGGFIMGIFAGFVILPSLAPAKSKCRPGRIGAVIVSLPIVGLWFIGLFVVFYKVVGGGNSAYQWCPICSQINCASAILGDKWCRKS